MKILFLIFLVEAWKCLLKEKHSFYSNKGNEVACMILKDEKEKLNEISKKVKLKNVYSDSESPFFLKKSN